jgi:hemoglobin
MGGPPSYSQSCGDQSGVLRMHAGNGDMGDLGERFVRCFDRAAAVAPGAAMPRWGWEGLQV